MSLFGELTAAVSGVTGPELQARGGRMLLAPVGRVQHQPELPLQRVEQSLEQRVVGPVGHVHQGLDTERHTTHAHLDCIITTRPKSSDG